MSVELKVATLASSQSTKLHVLHLDHSTEAGGAELALLRILLRSSSWNPSLRVPHRLDGKPNVFSVLTATARVRFHEVGRPQRPGASEGSRHPLKILRIAADALIQSARLRFSRDFAAADVIHANTSRSAVYGAVACAFSNKTLVVHLRDMADVDSLGNVGFRLFSGIALRRADGVIANSHATLESAQPYLRKHAARTVIASPIGFDERLATVNVSPTVSSIGMVARIDNWKGHALLIEAFSRACPSGGVRLVLAGAAAFDKESDLDELKRVAEQCGVADRVDFLGHVRDVRKLIADFDICVQASTRPEPLGQNVLQYLVSGKPTIAVNAGGPAEWIRHETNGLLFEMGSVDGLSDALHQLIDDHELRARLAQSALLTPGIGTDVEVAADHAAAFRTAHNARKNNRGS